MSYRWWLAIAVLVAAAAVRLPGLTHRALWGDEAIVLLETAGHPIPVWPDAPTPAAEVQRQAFEGTPSFAQLADDLRRTDVHPPVYYWGLTLWRRWLGFSLETARAFSLASSVATVLALYLLLRAGGFPNPLVPTAVYALSSISVHSGQDVRPYALAGLWVMLGALFAYLSAESGRDRPGRRTAYAVLLGLCCGLAFQTNYLALFPCGVMLAWFVVSQWSASRTLALLTPVLSGVIWLAAVPLLSTQAGAKPEQLKGFRGVLRESMSLYNSAVQIIAAPSRFFGERPQEVVLAVLFMALLGATGVQLVRHRSRVPRRLLWLVLALAVAPSAGLFALNLLTNRYLDSLRYVMQAAPFLAVALTYGVTTLQSSMRYVGGALLALLMCFQLAAINWGRESTDPYLRSGSNLRSFARLVRDSSSPSYLVVVTRGLDLGRGPQGALIHELDPRTMVMSVANASTLDQLPPSATEYTDLWLALFPAFSKAGGAPILSSLRQSPDYTEIALARETYDGRGSYYHFMRRGTALTRVPRTATPRRAAR